MRQGLISPFARESLGDEGLREVRAAEPADAFANIETLGRGFQSRLACRHLRRVEGRGLTAIEAFRTAQRNLLDELAAVAA